METKGEGILGRRTEGTKAQKPLRMNLRRGWGGTVVGVAGARCLCVGRGGVRGQIV